MQSAAQTVLQDKLTEGRLLECSDTRPSLTKIEQEEITKNAIRSSTEQIEGVNQEVYLSKSSPLHDRRAAKSTITTVRLEAQTADERVSRPDNFGWFGRWQDVSAKPDDSRQIILIAAGIGARLTEPE
jgi:hypothetical protein